MKIELWQVFCTVVAYLGVLFLVAYSAERGWIARNVLEHPLVYVLSLGVYATSWTYYGSVGLAAKSGYTFLTIYLGVTLAFILAPILLNPILRLVREYQLTSLADLFAFRFRNPLTGFLVTMFMLIGILPYISLQIQAVVESIQVLTGDMRTGILAPAFCVTLTVFAILFGARHITPREKHEGLVAAIAFESAVKLVALLAVGLFAIFGIFGGFGEMQSWLDTNPEALEKLYRPVTAGPWLTLLLLAFCRRFPAAAPVSHDLRGKPQRRGVASCGVDVPALSAVAEPADHPGAVGRERLAARHVARLLRARHHAERRKRALAVDVHRRRVGGQRHDDRHVACAREHGVEPHHPAGAVSWRQHPGQPVSLDTVG